MSNIFLKINNKPISNDDVLLTFSELNLKDKKMKYEDIIDFSLKSFFKNKNTLEKNILELQNILQTSSKYVSFHYLNKRSVILRNINRNNPVKNLCIVIELDKPIYDHNVISLYVDIRIKEDRKQELYFDLNRIEFLDENLSHNKSFNDDYVFNFSLAENEDKPTSFYDIEDLIISATKYFDNNDFQNDELLLSNWENFLRLLYDMYVKKGSSIKEDISNKLFLFQDKLYLASKFKFIANLKNQFLSIDNEMNEDYKIKTIEINQIDKNILFQEQLNENQNEIDRKIKETEQLKNKLENHYKDLNEWKNKIKDIEIQKENINSSIKNKEQNIKDFNKELKNTKKRIKKT